MGNNLHFNLMSVGCTLLPEFHWPLSHVPLFMGLWSSLENRLRPSLDPRTNLIPVHENQENDKEDHQGKDGECRPVDVEHPPSSSHSLDLRQEIPLATPASNDWGSNVDGWDFGLECQRRLFPGIPNPQWENESVGIGKKMKRNN